MAFADIFYPDNPKRRDNVVRLHQQIICCLESNVEYVNELTDILKSCCGKEVGHIKYDKKTTIKDTCDAFVAKITEIQAVVENLHKQLEDKLDKKAFLELSGMMESFSNGFHIARKVIPVIEGVLNAGFTIAVFAFKAFTMSAGVFRLCGCVSAIASSAFGVLAFGLVLLGVDMIISAILGAQERTALEQTIAEYEKHLETFKPASKDFQKAVIELQILIK